jgi:NAD kinase
MELLYRQSSVQHTSITEEVKRNVAISERNITGAILATEKRIVEIGERLHELSIASPTPGLPETDSDKEKAHTEIVEEQKVLESSRTVFKKLQASVKETSADIRGVGVTNLSKTLAQRPIKFRVRNIMIITGARDTQLVNLTREVAEWLMRTPRHDSDLCINVYIDVRLRASKRFNAAGLIESQPRFEHMLKYWSPDLCWTSPAKIDFVLTLGGDDAVLFASRLFQNIVPPVLGFNAHGSSGFLSHFDIGRYKEHLNNVLDGGAYVDLRLRFTCTVFRDSVIEETDEGEQSEHCEVLNEAVIKRGSSPYVPGLQLYGDNDLLTTIPADGCIFSTPTGIICLYLLFPFLSLRFI